MEKVAQFMRYFHKIPMIGILRGADTESLKVAFEAALRGGLRTLEITLNRPEACKQIAEIKSLFATDIEIGAGTVLDRTSAENAIAAGAEFIVTPVLLPDVMEVCRERSVPVFPGAEMVKVFPADTFGPQYINAVKAPFPYIRLMPTGGVTSQNIVDYLKAGADGFGIGGKIFRKEWMENKNWAAIEKTVKSYLDALEAAR